MKSARIAGGGRAFCESASLCLGLIEMPRLKVVERVEPPQHGKWQQVASASAPEAGGHVPSNMEYGTDSVELSNVHGYNL